MREEIARAVRRNLDWFRQSGVMDPADGSWGVAERVAVTEGNSALEKMLRNFPAWTMLDGCCIIEQRRADCNFQAAMLFLLAAKFLEDDDNRSTAENIFKYLYNRSGLLFTAALGSVPAGVWQWSHIRQEHMIYFDDNSWCLLMQIALMHAEPEWSSRFLCRERVLQLAQVLYEGARRSFANKNPENPGFCDPQNVWRGNIHQPHWGSLTCMALAAAYGVSPEEEYADFIRAYVKFTVDDSSSWNISELSYALIGAAFAARYLKEDILKDHVRHLEEKLLKRQDPVTGNFPSEHEREAPVGKDKVDTIYTVNWAFLALQCSCAVTGSQEARLAKNKLRDLLLQIQDTTPLPQFSGCWRGMYDLTIGTWGGGDRYEGGAGSIYTGWTNAPIAMGLLFELEERSLLDL